MTIFARFFRWLGGNANTQSKGSQQIQPGTSAHDDTPSIGVDGALQVSTVWACVTLLVDIISTLPLMVYETDGEGNRESAKGTILYRILHDRPNRIQTSIQFWAQMILNLVLRGNAYARIIRNNRGELVSLYPLSADQVETIVADDGSKMHAYYYDNATLIYEDRDILHIYGMGNGMVGLSALDYMRSSVGLAINAQNHTNKTYKKNARRPGILMSDNVLTKEQRDALKKNFGDIVSGTDKELYILEAQFKFDPLGMSPADIQLLETRQFAVQDLARWFGVPSVLINDNAETTSLGSSVYEIIQAFYKLRLRPKLELIEQCLQEKVLTPQQRSKGFVIEFNLDAFLRASASDRMEINAKAVQNGLRTRNECRAKDNLAPLEGGDILTAQSNLMPLDKLGTQINTGSVPADPIQQ